MKMTQETRQWQTILTPSRMNNGLLSKSLCNGRHLRNEVFLELTRERFGIRSFISLLGVADGAIFLQTETSMQLEQLRTNGFCNGSTKAFLIGS